MSGRLERASMRSTVARVLLVLTIGSIIVSLLWRVQTASPTSSGRLPLSPSQAAHRQTKPVLQSTVTYRGAPGWLHTDGTWIVDANNHPVRLASVNWYGAEGGTFVPGGLSNRPYMDILRTIKSLGFNSIRYAFSNELVERNPVIRRYVDANPQFRGQRALQVMDTILAGARRVGLMVILADMSSEAHAQ